MSSKDIRKKFWDIFSRMRDTDIDFQVFLLVLIFYKKDFLREYLESKVEYDFEDYSFQKIQGLSKKENLLMSEAANFFRADLRKFKKHHISFIQESLEQSDLSLESIFDKVLIMLNESMGRMRGEFVQPKELSELMIGIVSPRADETIFNPFAGIGSLCVHTPKKCSYYGQEINERTYFLGALRLIAYERFANETFELQDSFYAWPSHKYNYILFNPPFNLRLNKDQYPEVDASIIEKFYVEKSIESLENNGKAVIVFPQGFMFNSRKKYIDFRKHLIEKDYIESIISFPGGIFQYTGIQFSLMVLSKKKKESGYVKLIDAYNLVKEGDTSRDKLINVQEILKLYHTDVEGSNCRLVSLNEISENDFNLSISRYFIEDIEGIELKKVLRPAKKQRVDREKEFKVLKIGDLSESDKDIYVDTSDIEKSKVKTSGYQVEEPALLVASRFKSIKPTYLNDLDNELAISNNIRAFEIDEEFIDKRYLVHELRKDYVQKQFTKYQTGTSIPYLSKDDFLNIKIRIPSLDEQKRIVESLDELSQKISNLEKEKERFLLGEAKNKFDELASLKHTLGRPRQNILDWSDNLLHFFKENKQEVEEISRKFKSFYGYDLTEVFKEIKNDITQITNVLEKGEETLNVEKYELRLLSLKECVQLIKSLSKSNSKFELDKQFLLEGNQNERGILGNKVLFRTLFDNLLTNANKYAFDKSQKENLVRIIVKEEEGKLLLVIKDNGVGFPKNFTKEKFIQKYKTSNNKKGSGLGGFHIDQIAARFNNTDWKLNLNKDPIFKVEFVFNFEIKPI